MPLEPDPIRLTEDIAVVGSGATGLTHPSDCHVYLISRNGEAALVDCGVGKDTQRIIRNVQKLGVTRLKYILLTHAHADHAGGVGAIQSSFGGKVVASPAESRLLSSGTEEELGLTLAKERGRYPFDYQYRHFDVDRVVEHGDNLHVGDTTIQVVSTAGHSVGSICFLLLDEERTLFAGDAVFTGGYVCVLDSFPQGVSLYQRELPNLAGLNVDRLLSGHYLWRLSDGQRQVDLAIEKTLSLGIAPNFPA